MPTSSKVRQINTIPGEPLRFWVDSSEGDIPHMVDLLEKSGNGECSCRDFQIRCQRQFRENGRNRVEYGNPDRTRCKHINAVCLFLANKVIEEVKNEHSKSN